MIIPCIQQELICSFCREGARQAAAAAVTVLKFKEPSHGKMCLKIFVIVIPKEGLAGWTPPILLLVWHRLQNRICKGSFHNFIVSGISKEIYSRCHIQRRIGGAQPTNPSLGMTTIEILRPVFAWHTLQLQLPALTAVSWLLSLSDL